MHRVLRRPALALLIATSAAAPSLHAQDARAALDRLNEMTLDSIVASSTVYFRSADRERARALHSMLDEFVDFWNPRLGRNAHLRLAVLAPDDWSKLTQLPYGFPNSIPPPADLILGAAAPQPATGLDTLLIDGARDGRDWLLIGHEGGHLLNWALLPASVLAFANDRTQMDTTAQRLLRRVDRIPKWFWEYAANYFLTAFLEARHPASAATWKRYLEALSRPPAPRYSHLDDWFGEFMQARAADGSPYFLSTEGSGNFAWYQGVAGALGAHVLARGGDGIAHIRRIMTGDDVPTTASLLEDLESIAPGTLALADRLGAGYRERDQPPAPMHGVLSRSLAVLIAAPAAYRPLHAQQRESALPRGPATFAERVAPVIEWAELPPHIELPDQLRDSVRFGYLHVPQDHAQPTGPMMRMAFAIVPATTPDPAPDPLVFIVGGPGLPGIEPHFRNRLRGPHPLDVHRGRRDLIVFDQRGNGLSDPRRCPGLNAARPTFDTDAESPAEHQWLEMLANCRGQLLAAGVRLETISSVQVAHDLEWLRRALGAPQLNLIGNSYGSRIAAEVVRQAPAGIRAVNFSGPVPPGRQRVGIGPEQAEEVLVTLFRRCAERPQCHAAYPRLRAEYDAVLARLHENPFRVRLPPSELGPGGERLVDDVVMRGGVADLLLNRELAASVPLLIHTMFEHGDAFLRRMAPQLARELMTGEQDAGTALAFWCNDGGVNRDSESLHRQRCRAWLGEAWDEAGAEALRSDVASLIDTGELDPRTPPSNARFLAAGLPRSHLVIVPWYGHEEPSPCALRIARDFIDAPERAPDTACLDSVPPIEFVTGVTYSGWVGAAVTRTWQRPWLAGLPGVAALLLLVSAVGIPLRERRDHERRTSRTGRAATLALLVAALVGLTFVAGLAGALTTAARRHPFIPAIGLPANWTWLLVLPWLLLAGIPVAAVLAMRARRDGHSLGIPGWSAAIGSGLLLATWVVNLLY
ncbi:MAG TPA: alpha/beta hydrolase [Longimicrobiales bacterium]